MKKQCSAFEALSSEEQESLRQVVASKTNQAIGKHLEDADEWHCGSSRSVPGSSKNAPVNSAHDAKTARAHDREFPAVRV